MRRTSTTLERMFSSLRIPNYRRYFYGQIVSLIGTWMQSLAQAWLVFRLTGSGTYLGLVVAMQFLPVLVLAPYGGVIADRVDKRRLLMLTQSVMGVLALALGVLSVTHEVRLYMVFGLAFGLGLANAFDNPARQAFVLEMVGRQDARNAVSLNSVVANAARAVGPALAGVLISTAGVGVCFLLNAGSFGAVLLALHGMDPAALHAGDRQVRARGQIRDGVRYVRGTPDLLIPLLMMALVGMLAYEFQITLPLMAKNAFHGGASAYGFLSSAMGIGAVAGGLWAAGRARLGLRPLSLAAVAFGVVILAAAAAPNLSVEAVALVAVGAVSVSFLSIGNTTLQLAASPLMRGRVMALWSVAFLGSTPLGGPIAGWLSQHAGPRYGLVLGGGAALVAALIGMVAVRSRRRAAGGVPVRAGEPAMDSSRPATGALAAAGTAGPVGRPAAAGAEVARPQPPLAGSG